MIVGGIPRRGGDARVLRSHSALLLRQLRFRHVSVDLVALVGRTQVRFDFTSESRCSRMTRETNTISPPSSRP